MIPKQKDYANDVIKYADQGNLKKLRKAVEKDPLLVTKFDDHALSPLHYAAASGSMECVDLLLMNGAKANSNARYGEATALHSALLAKQEGTALLLLKHGANPDTVYQTKSGFMLSSEMGKRFELEFRETAKKNSHKVNTSPMVPQSPRQNITTTTAPQAAAVPPDSPVTYAPPKPIPTPTNQPGLKRQVSIPDDMKPISPADAVQQAMDMLGMGTLKTMDSFQAEKEKETMQFNKLSSSQALQAKITERKSVLERRMHKCEAIQNALEPFTDVTDMTAPDVRSAVTALGFTLDPISAAKPAGRTVVRRKKAAVLQKRAQEAAAEQPAPQAGGVSPRPNEPPATGRMTHRPPAVAVASKQINPESAAEAIICHFKSWFDPSVSDAVLPAWYPPASKEAPAAANAGAAAGQRPGQIGAPVTPTSPSQGGSTPTAGGPMVPLADVMLDWAKHLCYMPILTKDFDFQRLRDKEIRIYVEEFRQYHLALATQVNMQQEILGDSFRETKMCVDSLRDRVINLLDQYYTVALRHEDPAILLLAFMMIVGASFFTFQAMFSAEQQAIVANTKEFVSAILNLGKVDDGELLAAFSCMKLNAVINALVFRCSSPQVAKELSFHNSTIALTARAMVTDAKQGNPKRNDYNVSIGSHLSKMKDLVRGAARSHRGDPLPVKEDSHVLDMSTKYLTQVLMFYKKQIPADDEDGKVLLGEIEKIIPMITKFSDLYIHSREVTLYSWVDVLQAAMDLCDAVCHFCDETVSCLDDPDGFFDAAILIAKQYVLQLILAITCLAAENPVCPRHQISFAIRALSIHLVNFMDLYYLTA